MTFREALDHFLQGLGGTLNTIKAGGPEGRESRRVMEPYYAALEPLMNVFSLLTFNQTQDKSLLSAASEEVQRERVKKVIMYLKLVLEEQPVQARLFNPHIPKDAQKLLWHLRQDLLSIYKIAWSYAYPQVGQGFESKGEDGEVMNEAIKAWAERQIKLPAPSGPEAAFTDFKRLCSIEGKIRDNDEAIKQAITALLNAATGYSDQEKLALKEWLNSYGGQEGALYLVPVLFNQGHFSTEQGGRYQLGGNKLIAPNWLVEVGKINCEYEQAVTNIIHYTSAGGARFIFMDRGRVAEEQDDLPENSRNLPPLLRLKVKMELAVANLDEALMVRPKVKTLDVTSYTNYLLSPEEALKPTVSAQPQAKI